jgi:competence protein ComEA
MPAGYRKVFVSGVGLLAVRMAMYADQAQSEAADQRIFAAVCGTCHTVGMVSDIRGEDEWAETIERMVSIGAKGSEEQLEAAMRFLLRTLTKVNVNTATAAQLPLVLDISEATARAVVKYRGEHGSFKTLDDLKKAPGIDAAKLEARKQRVVF